MSLQGKTVAMTGAASGIGAATAALLKEAGARVIALSRHSVPTGVDETIPIDLAHGAAIDAAAARIQGPVHALCNIAGVSMAPPPAHVLKVNFLGTRRLTEALSPKLADGGAVINVSSVGGMAWRDNLDQVKALMAVRDLDQADAFAAEHDIQPMLSYKLSKECIIAWTQTLAVHWVSRRIRVNCVSPGPVETPLYREAEAEPGGRGAEIRAKSPRIAEPMEIARVIRFLVGEDAAWINGTDIAIDGGLSAVFNRERLGF
jgi:NAD(P)-dependent dehydrogenase (short-subunit alcohol dehydrogenase family)